VAQLRGAEREIKNRARKNEAIYACFTHGKGGNAIAALQKDELTKFLEHMGTLRRSLRGTAKGKVFVWGFGSQFVVVVRSFLSFSFESHRYAVRRHYIGIFTPVAIFRNTQDCVRSLLPGLQGCHLYLAVWRGKALLFRLGPVKRS
jgi:hypothetical protein